MAEHPILLTAFEPSGDALAARLIVALKQNMPGRKIIAFGGDLMRDAGAELIASTCDDGVMGLDAAKVVVAHLKRMRLIKDWLKRHPIDLLIPVDSPTANGPVCGMVRALQPSAKIVHLVMPQLWAWRSWRVRKLRRRTDHVLCLLPFEPAWLEARGVQGSFVGHPLYSTQDPLQPSEAGVGVEHWPVGGPKVVLLPGSRGAELKRNLPTMAQAWSEVHRQRPEATAILAARTEANAKTCQAIIEQSVGEAPGLTVVHGRTADAMTWADAALATSGTVTLQLAAAHTPTVAMYNHSAWQWNLVGRWLIEIRTFTLPNLISEHMGLGRVVPEFVPHFGDPAPLTQALFELLDPDGDALAKQREGFALMREAMAAVSFEAQSMSVIREILG